MNTDKQHLPVVSPFLQNGFHRYLSRMLRSNFHTLAVAADTWTAREIPPELPLIVYANHPSWWDPLIAHYLCRHAFDGRQFYAPIDAEALKRYRILAKLGFYGVQGDTATGVAAFIKISRAILATPGTSVWITPTGRFTDPRDRDVEFAAGLAHLCSRLERGIVLPLALEYPFWEERLPECLLRFGAGIAIETHAGWDKSQWSELLTDRLQDSQQQLARLVIRRDADSFQPILRGGVGFGRLYDRFRQMRSWWSGQPVSKQHGKKFS